MSGYIGPLPVPQGIQRKQSFTATASQTTFNTNGYTDGDFINVYLNGVRLINGTDYTATNGSDVVLTQAASVSDVLDFETFNSFSLVDQTFDNVTLKNPTHEDTDGGRESAVSFKGEQSGGEISTLAQIQASHDGTSDDQKGDLIFKTNDGSDNDAPTEAARIDSAQNLLVGKTDTGVTTSGTIVQSNGSTWKIRDGNAPLFLKRLSSDGDIVEFYKDGSSVGSIGSTSGVVSHIVLDPRTSVKGSGLSGASIDANTGVINPADRTGATSDGNINIGSTGARFQHIFLSGGVYLGGTTSNNRLDDYEEGSWTPTYTSGITGATVNYAKYVKVGALVNIGLYIGSFSGKDGGSLVLAGLPFTVRSAGYGSAIFESGSTGDTGLVRTQTNSNTLDFYSWNTSTLHRENYVGNELGGHLILNICYHTDS